MPSLRNNVKNFEKVRIDVFSRSLAIKERKEMKW